MQNALLLIDFQNNNFKGGNNAVKGAKRCSKIAEELLTYFREHQLPVAHALQLVHNDEQASIENGGFWEKTAPQDHEETHISHSANVFADGVLHEKLQSLGVTELVFACINTDDQLNASVRAAKALGYACTTIQDACVTNKLSFEGHRISADTVLRVLLASLNGTYTQICTAEEFLKGEQRKKKKAAKQIKKEAKEKAKVQA